MRTATFIPLALFLVTGAAGAQQSTTYDHLYRSEEKKRFEQDRERFLEGVQYIYFAVGCQVVPGYRADAATQGEAFRLVQRSRGILNGDFFKVVSRARSEGIEKAKSLDACKFWKEHPDQVYELRNAIDDSTSGFVPFR